MSIDNTHTKYLQGRDKKIWNGYKEALEARNKLDDFMDGFGIGELEDGEEIDIPYRR